MARKKKDQDAPEAHRPKGAAREQVVMSIVLTDATFSRYGDARQGQEQLWIGRCIHCNTRLTVSMSGSTAATIEHINPLCNDGASVDPRNLALACSRCNNEKGIRHDQHAGKGGRADEVISALYAKRMQRWRDPRANS